MKKELVFMLTTDNTTLTIISGNVPDDESNINIAELENLGAKKMIRLKPKPIKTENGISVIYRLSYEKLKQL